MRSAMDLSIAISKGEVDPADLMEETLDRIAASGTNAIVSLRLRDDLIAEAKAKARTAIGPDRMGWLHGIPVAVKDLVATQGIRTTYGSPLFADHVPEADDLLAARLRACGAILIGKTNTPEFGLGSNTFNPVHGITRNPYDPARTPGGSSGGAAVALAEGLVAVADGSDMMGSLRNPASFCNVYGMRPTAGLVPTDPLGDAFSVPLSTDGPMARDPRDLGALLHTLSEPDPRWPHLGVSLEDTPSADPARIGWPGAMGLPFEDGILDLCEGALDPLGDAVPLDIPLSREELWSCWTTLRSFAVAMKLREAWADPAQRDRLKGTAAWEIERGLALSALAVREAQEARTRLHAALAPVWDRVDAITLPSAQVLPYPVETEYPTEIAGTAMDTYHRWMEVVLIPSLFGLPAVACPAGFVGGLPCGFQLIGPRGSDARLLSLARRYHEATGWPQAQPPKPPR